jgi:hypothetical protein
VAHTLSVRLDDAASEALSYLEAVDGVSRSDALRRALMETARRRRDEALRREAECLNADADHQAELAAVASALDVVSAPWPD